MKFSAKASVLLKALDDVQGIVDKKSTNRILSNVRINAADDKLIINATDTEIDIVEHITANVTIEGSTTVSATMLHETIKRLPSQSEVSFDLDDDKLQIICDGFKGNLSCLPVKDFPSIYIDSLPHKLEIAVEDFRRILSKTRVSVASDDSRFYLNGIYIHTTKNTKNEHVVRAVSTDSHRLSMAEIICIEDFDIPKGIILPKKSADELLKLLSRTTDKHINIALSNTRASFSLTNVVLTSKLIDGDYPNYQTVIPTNNEKVIEIDRTKFLHAIDLISTYTDIHRTLTLSISGNKLTLKARSSVNVAEQTIEIISTIDQMDIGFNAKYIKDACDSIETSNVIINLSSSSTPALFKHQGDIKEIFVVMPIRLIQNESQ